MKRDEGGQKPVVAAPHMPDPRMSSVLWGGFDAHIAKPVDAADLSHIITDLTGSSKK